MFVDELSIEAKAGNGGDGVVRWRHEKHKPRGGPSGGNGGRGGNVYVRGVRDLNLLSKYTGSKIFNADNGADGRKNSEHGKNGEDYIIDVPVGSKVTDLNRDRVFEIDKENELVKILIGGSGGLGNEYFKSSTNVTPLQCTQGKAGESGSFLIELGIVADVGLIGFPNAGKSTLLNALTNASSQVGSYAFTTLEPHLGSFYGYTLVDIPGLIEGASVGKGLGHKFLKHISKTKMLLHLVSLESESPKNTYYTIRKELSDYSKLLEDKEEWIILTKSDLLNKEDINEVVNIFDKFENRVFVLSVETGDGLKELADALVSRLREK
ncbi:GTPase ObgE [Candidatus Kaiserbacteria bacterium]|nr:GTPase ObgE [Candidatus Kaiserbacteria bacterium]